MVVSSGIQEARFVLFATDQLDIPASQSSCSLRDLSPVPFASNYIALSTYLLNPGSHWLVRSVEFWF